MKNSFLIVFISFFFGNIAIGYCQVKPMDTIKLKSVLVTNTVKHSKSWYVFKSQYLDRINSLSDKLTALQNKSKVSENGTNDQFANKIMVLDQRYQSLINRLNSYEKDKPNWSIFKREFLKEFTSIEEDLRKLTSTGTY